MPSAFLTSYRRDGYVLLPGAIPDAAFAEIDDALEEKLKNLIFPGVHSPALGAMLRDTPGIHSHVYETMRVHPALRAFSAAWTIREPVCNLFGWGVETSHERLRMDLPNDTRYVAHWHQDHAYMPELPISTITAWVPLQDVGWAMGPLLVAPGSHAASYIHDPGPNGRRVCYPVTGDDIAVLPMRRGDLLLFHSCLLHSGQVNFSDRVRFSFQARYSPVEST